MLHPLLVQMMGSVLVRIYSYITICEQNVKLYLMHQCNYDYCHYYYSLVTLYEVL